MFKSESSLYGPQGSITLKDKCNSDGNMADMEMIYIGNAEVFLIILNIIKGDIQLKQEKKCRLKERVLHQGGNWQSTISSNVGHGIMQLPNFKVLDYCNRCNLVIDWYVFVV